MKKAITVLLIMLSLGLSAQDSARVTVTPQARDLEYITSKVYLDDRFEDFVDTLKGKFRVQNPPTGTETLSVTAYAVEWVNIYSQLVNDATSIQANCTNRIKAILLALNKTYITDAITNIDTALELQYQEKYQTGRQFGRVRLRRVNN